MKWKERKKNEWYACVIFHLFIKIWESHKTDSNIGDSAKLTKRQRATLHPRVPAPKSKHFADFISSKRSSGKRRQRMSFRFKSTAESASLKKRREKSNQNQIYTYIN